MKQASGTFVLRLDPELHLRLREMAARREVSLNRLCAEVLRRAVSEPEGDAPQAGSAEVITSLDLVVQRCRRVFEDALIGVLVFGSVARGDQRADSDLDLLLVVRRDQPLRRGLYARWAEEVESFAEDRLRREVNPHFCHVPDTPDLAGALWFEVSIDGVVLWERDGEVSRHLRGVRLYLAGGGATRRVQHGHAYWVRHAEHDAPRSVA